MKDEEVISLINNRFNAVERRFDGVNAGLEDIKTWRCPDIIEIKTIISQQEKQTKTNRAIVFSIIGVAIAIIGLFIRGYK